MWKTIRVNHSVANFVIVGKENIIDNVGDNKVIWIKFGTQIAKIKNLTLFKLFAPNSGAGFLIFKLD